MDDESVSDVREMFPESELSAVVVPMVDESRTRDRCGD